MAVPDDWVGLREVMEKATNFKVKWFTQAEKNGYEVVDIIVQTDVNELIAKKDFDCLNAILVILQYRTDLDVLGIRALASLTHLTEKHKDKLLNWPSFNVRMAAFLETRA